MGKSDGGSEAARPQGYAPHQIPGDADLLSLSGNAIVLAQHPNFSRPIIDLEGTLAHEAEAFGDCTFDPDLLVVIAARIVIQVADFHLLRTTNQKYQ